MSEGVNERLAARLNARAPAERDALFRIQVLERREQARFARRKLMIVGAACAFAIVCALGMVLRPDLLEEIGALIVGVAAVGAAVLYRSTLLRLIGRLPI